ncbi:cysteine peptidase C50 [Coprinopsis sp. MPI-PUGE-AT-0042]|nr:cysteine peptidase C50 [Coprinopsis sp. MPI-PUGE-AT-0042]
MASKQRRTAKPTTAAASSSSRLADPTPDQLADAVATKLTIQSKSSTKAKATSTSRGKTATSAPKDDKVAAMRGINTCLQSLSNLVKAGWKQSAISSDSTWKARQLEAKTLAKKCNDLLSALRRLGVDGDRVDVERAALSVVGKLVALDMLDAARDALERIHEPLHQALDLPCADDPLLASLPEMEKRGSLNAIHLTMVSTYLVYAITTTSHSIEKLADILDGRKGTLVEWIPLLESLEKKYVDSLLTRCYTSLTRCYTSLTRLASSPAPSTAKAKQPVSKIFALRMYALTCLAQTSPGVIERDTFWDQVLKFTASFIKTTDDEDEAAQLIQRHLERIVQCASQKEQWLEGEKFIGVCEVWIGIAKKQGDICLLDRIATLVNGNPPSTPGPSKLASRTTTPSIDALAAATANLGLNATPARPTTRELIQEGTKIYAVLTQGPAALDQDKPIDPDERKRSLNSCVETLQNSHSLLHLLLGDIRDDEDDGKDASKERADFDNISGKVDRAFERMRRSATGLVESGSKSSAELSVGKDDGVEVLVCCVKVLQGLLNLAIGQAQKDHSKKQKELIIDILSRALNSLFLLARVKLDVSNPQSYIPAYDHLEEAVKMCDAVENSFGNEATGGQEEDIDVPNYRRCISGAFYNLAGRVYQAGRYGAAVPFLKKTCVEGESALEGWKAGSKGKLKVVNEPENAAKGKVVKASASKAKDAPERKTKQDERQKEWTQLNQQLFKRYELLANSYDTFRKCIQVFPFDDVEILSRTNKLCLEGVFNEDGDSQGGTSLVKQLTNLLERVTHVGASELLLGPEEISFKSFLSSPGQMDAKLVGVLLEFQYDSLLPNRHKDGARDVLMGLMKDTLDVYDAGVYPVRRSRVLLKCLEFFYRDGGESDLGDLGSVERMIKEAIALSQTPAQDLGEDSALAVYLPQYRIASHLWAALHSHRQSKPDQICKIVAHVGQAASALKGFLDVSHGRRQSAAPGGHGHPLSSSVRRKVSVSPKVVKARTARGGKTALTVVKTTSPKVTRTTRNKAQPSVPAAPRKPARTAAATSRTRTVPTATTKAKPASSTRHPTVPTTDRDQAPVTPKAARTAPEGIPSQVTAGSRRSTLQPAPPSALPFDDFSKFHDLMMLTVRILGLLSITLPRVQLLASLRKLCQRQLGSSSEAFIICSLELAYDYAQLGKLKKATSIFGTALDVVRSGETSPEVSAFYLLRFAEALALASNSEKSAKVYLEALDQSNTIEQDHRGMSTTQRVHSRTRRLELSAMAAYVFALIQLAKGDVTASLNGMLQSLRVWNRAAETVSRLSKPIDKGSPQVSDANPFESAPNNSGQPKPLDDQTQKPTPRKGSNAGELEWRVFQGLLTAMFCLSDAYLSRGSPREAEYFLQQVRDLAQELNLPVVVGRAHTRMSQVQIGLGKVDAAKESLELATSVLGQNGLVADDETQAEELSSEGALVAALETVENKRLQAQLSEKAEMVEDAQTLLYAGMKLLEQLDGDFRELDSNFMSLRRSSDNQSTGDVVMPDLLALVLCRCIWLLRDSVDTDFHALMERLGGLPMSTRTKVEENSLMANLTLHNVYNRFRSDMFLSSLTESTIAIPVGMSSQNDTRIALPVQDVLVALDSAEKHLNEGLKLTLGAGDVIKAREAAVSLTMVKIFQTSLGRLAEESGVYASSLLDTSSALTLRREMLEAIQQKIANLRSDDTEWPRITPEGQMAFKTSAINLDSDDEAEGENHATRSYWESVRHRYESLLEPGTLAHAKTASLPSNWTVVHVTITEDKNTLLISRQECGTTNPEPVLFCVPLKGRRDGGAGEDEEHLTYEDAINEFEEIIRLSDQGTKNAINIRSDDQEARSNWWKQRNLLDQRMKDLLENIEFCWLGAFKTILSPRPDLTPDLLADLRGALDRVFQRSLHVKDTKKPLKGKSANHKRAFSQSLSPSQVSLDDTMLRCFSTLSPKCKDEELEDLLYFVLDLYQLHGVQIAIAEVDALQVVVDLRTVLEEHHARWQKHRKANPSSSDEHLFLVLDKNIQGLPWESLPILRGRSISRIPCIDFLLDRVDFANLKRLKVQPPQTSPPGSAMVDVRNGYFILNPSGDLGKTEGRFKEWADEMKELGWDGVMGHAVSEQQLAKALETRDLVVYFGHGGAEQYIRSHKIRSLPTCAATMLWGCSSGALRDMGDFDRIGTPYNYMLGGCPTLIANLWDVTDRDIDKFSQSVFDKLRLKAGDIERKSSIRKPVSVVTAVAESRDVPKLKYLTGAAPVVYGIPFYL